MQTELFVFSLATGCAAAVWYGHTYLPQERWQILASVPVRKDSEGRWEGVNITWYGVLIATAKVCGAGLALTLLTGMGIPLPVVLATVALILGASLPAAKIVAKFVERRQSTFTVAGASCVGFTISPWIVFGLARLGVFPAAEDFPTMSVLAGLVVAYPLGEGLGRLACVSFGCCYGKPLDQCGATIQNLLAPWAITFEGPTKKANYEGRLQGRPLVPIQLITSGVNLLITVGALELLLHEFSRSAYLLAVAGSQTWRVISETLRADYRGGGKISAYQWMALFSAAYAIATSVVLPNPPVSINLLQGLQALWNPLAIISLQGLWISIVWYMGRSTVTAATLAFRVRYPS